MESYWQFEPVFESYLAVAAVGAMLLMLLLIQPAFAALSRRRKGWLLGLRVLLILLLVVALLRPTRISTSAKPQPAVLILLVDKSRSMQLPNESGGKSRWEAMNETLREAEPLLAELGQDLEIRPYVFDRELKLVEFEGRKLKLPSAPDGDQTDIGSSLHQAVMHELGKRIAAVVMLSDGTQTAFDPDVEIYEAGRELGQMGYPLYTIAYGPAGDASQGRDVAVENLPEQYTVFVKNELVVRGVLRVRGYVNQPIQVQLLVEDASGNQQELQQRELRSRKDGELVPIEMSYTPDEPGQFKLVVRAAEQPGELVIANNQLSAYVNVLEGGLKVAYVYGDRLGEQRYLRWSIGESPDIDLNDVFLDIRNRNVWPVELADVLADSTYDAFLIENVDASAFREQDLESLAQLIDQGKGFLMIGGYHSFGPGGYHSSPLADVLPVEMSRYERQELGIDRQISEDLHLSSVDGVAMLPTGDHPITHLAPEGENEARWRQLPRLHGANRLAPHAAARVLAESPAGAPLLIAGEYGQGRVLAFAGDTTRLWWQKGRRPEHKRFWRQVIMWLAQREDDQSSNVWVRLEQRRFSPGADVAFTAGARSPAGDPLPDANLAAELLLPNGEKQSVSLARDQEDYRGRIEALEQPGDYVLEVRAQEEGETIGKAQASFQMLDRDIELSNPAADPDQLARLAHLTKELDGAPIAPEQLPDLLRKIKRRPPEEVVKVQSKWQLASTWWDAWLFFLAFVTLLTAEWYLRKRWGMV